MTAILHQIDGQLKKNIYIYTENTVSSNAFNVMQYCHLKMEIGFVSQ